MGRGRRGTRRAGKSSLSMGACDTEGQAPCGPRLAFRAVLCSDTPGQTPKSPWGLGAKKYKTVKQEITNENRILNGKGPRDPNSHPLVVYDMSRNLLSLSDPQFPYYKIEYQQKFLCRTPSSQRASRMPFVQQSCFYEPAAMEESTSLRGVSGTGLYQNYSGTLAHVK